MLRPQHWRPSTLPNVSVVIPAFNEAASIAGVVRVSLSVLSDGDEVVVVDDGSTDDTAVRAAEAGARVVRFARNRGKGAALGAGIEAARGDVCVFIDADGQDDPREIPMLLEAMDEDVAMVIGSRFIGTFQDGAITQLNKLGSRALLELLNGLFRVHITDPFAGFRAVRKSALSSISISASGFDIEVDILLALLRRGERVVEVPVTRKRRAHGTSHLRSIEDGFRILRRILWHRVRNEV